MKKYASYACILAAAACWGCIGLFNRPLLNAGIAPENLVVIRNLGGLAVMALFFLCTDRSVHKMKAKHLPIFIATGIISVVLFTLCYFNAQALLALGQRNFALHRARDGGFDERARLQREDHGAKRSLPSRWRCSAVRS